MSREKQIEEMARDICECFNNDGTCYQDDRLCDCKCDSFTDAQYLYEKGYRKQREGKWIKATPCSQEYCNQCGLTPKTIFGKLPPFCPNCGAKMKGENK
jgi:hypothetical protein